MGIQTWVLEGLYTYYLFWSEWPKIFSLVAQVVVYKSYSQGSLWSVSGSLSDHVFILNVLLHKDWSSCGGKAFSFIK